MYKKILVAIDSSSISDRALKEAVTLAKDMGSRLRIVHAVDASLAKTNELEGIIDVDEFKQKLRQGGKVLLGKAQEKAKQSGVDAETGLLDIDGKRIAGALGEDATSWQADLIVMGTHGRTGFSYLLMGSVAEDFIRIAKAPILLVHGE